MDQTTFPPLCGPDQARGPYPSRTHLALTTEFTVNEGRRDEAAIRCQRGRSMARLASRAGCLDTSSCGGFL